MIQMIEANWLAFVLALVIGVLVAWWLFGRTTSAGKTRSHAPDVLDEGAAPAQRNQALIDAPSASSTTTVTTAAKLADTGPDVMAGIGGVVASAAASEVVSSEAATAEPAPAAETPAPVAAPTGTADNLTRIKGVGPKLNALLGQLGVTTFAQIAAWTDADIDRIDAQLGSFAGRVRRDNWVEQCRHLAAGDTAGFEGKFGKL